MEKIEKTVIFTKLFNLYGTLLSHTQQDIFKDYYFADLSISEISENRKISRAAVEDALSKATKKLLYYEEQLKMLDERVKRQKAVEKVQELTEIIVDTECLRILDEILGNLNDGIWKFDWKDISYI